MGSFEDALARAERERREAAAEVERAARQRRDAAEAHAEGIRRENATARERAKHLLPELRKAVRALIDADSMRAREAWQPSPEMGRRGLARRYTFRMWPRRDRFDGWKGSAYVTSFEIDADGALRFFHSDSCYSLERLVEIGCLRWTTSSTSSPRGTETSHHVVGVDSEIAAVIDRVSEFLIEVRRR
jgi:hypothetical protein